MKNFYTTLICFFTAISAFSQAEFSVFTTTSYDGDCSGTATIIIESGTGPFVYSWSPVGGSTSGLTGLCPGDYTVTVMDNMGETSVENFTIYDSLVLHINTNPAVNGACTGQAEVIIESGTAPYTYSWEASGTTQSVATNLCPGTSTVTITDASGVMGTYYYSIEDSIVPADTLAFHVVTNNTYPWGCTGNAAVIIDSGDGPFTYSWSTGSITSNVTDLCSGIFTVAVTDMYGTEITETFAIDSILILNPISVEFVVTPDAEGDCSGSATAVFTGGEAPYTVTWNAETTAISPDGLTASGICAGIYNITVFDSEGTPMNPQFGTFVILGSEDTYTDSNDVVDPPSDTLSGGLTENCDIDYSAIDSVQLAALVNSDSTVIIHWTVYQMDGSVTNVYDTLSYGGEAGVYLIEGIYYCPEKSVGQFAGFSGYADLPTFAELGIKEEMMTGVAIYPNPFGDSFSLSFEKAGSYSVIVTDASGRIVLSRSVEAQTELIETAGFGAGVYFVHISNGTESAVKKIIKN